MAIDEGANSGEGRLAFQAGGAGDGSVSGMDLGAPVGAESVGDLAEDDGGPDFPFGDVVGGRHASVGQEDEELGAPRLDLPLQKPSGGVSGGVADQGVEASFGLRRIGGQRAVLQVGSSLADPDGPSQVVADFWRDHRIAAVDGVLHVAQNMGETDLMDAGQILLPRIAIRNPDFGPVTVQHGFGDALGPARGDFMQNRLIRDEHPLLLGHTIDAGGGFVRGDDSGGQQLGFDRRPGLVQTGLAPPKGIGDGAF